MTKPTYYTYKEFEDNRLPLPKISPYSEGQDVGKFTLLGYGYAPHVGKNWYYLQCFCGNIITAKAMTSIQRGKASSCGCEQIRKRAQTRFSYFLEECEINNPHDYDLSNITFDDWKLKKVKIICPIHAEQWISPHRLRQGKSCGKCGKDAASRSRIKTTEQFIKDAKKIHGDRYDYSDTVYNGSHEKLEIYCKESQAIFTPTATDHLSGCRCACCNTGTFSRVDPIEIYVSEWRKPDGEYFYKVGITSVDSYTRLHRQGLKTKAEGKLILIRSFKDSHRAIFLEEAILNTIDNGYVKWSDFPDGYTETFHEKDLCTVFRMVYNA